MDLRGCDCICCFKDGVVELFDVFLIHTGVGHPEVFVLDGDGADSVIMEEFQSEFLRASAFEKEAHKVSGIKWQGLQSKPLVPILNNFPNFKISFLKYFGELSLFFQVPLTL